MRFSAIVTVVFAALFSTVHSHPAADLEIRSPAINAPMDVVEKRQSGGGGGGGGAGVSVSLQASVTVDMVLQATLEKVRMQTGAINATLATINQDSTWVMKNNAIMSIRSELNTMGSVLAASTSQIGTLGGNLGADLNGIANGGIAIVNEILFTLQNAVNKLGSGVLVVLGIIINNVMSVLAGLLLAINILAHGSLAVTNASLNAGTANVSPAMVSIVQGLNYLIGY